MPANGKPFPGEQCATQLRVLVGDFGIQTRKIQRNESIQKSRLWKLKDPADTNLEDSEWEIVTKERKS